MEGDVNVDNAEKLLNILENNIHLEYNPDLLRTVEIDLENELTVIMEETAGMLENMDSRVFTHPSAGEGVLTAHKIPYDYLHR